MKIATPMNICTSCEGLLDEGPADEGTMREGPVDEGTMREGPLDEGLSDEGTSCEGLRRRDNRKMIVIKGKM